uniref:Glutathione peroxidase n=1 Tax=Chlorella sp. NJ-18 TaxID=371065 RepID=I1VWQ3_9CHLO|nr:GPX1a [Chlorella sp. NJ-18]
MQTSALFGGSATAGKSLYDYDVKSIDGKDIKMDKFKGKVLLVINVASACGFTPQYTEMSELYNKYSKDGLEVLAFPCNQFGAQEPGSNSEIKSFAERKGFKGPMFAKTDVNGPNALPLFDFLKGQQGGLLTSDIKTSDIKVGRRGRQKGGELAHTKALSEHAPMSVSAASHTCRPTPNPTHPPISAFPSTHPWLQWNFTKFLVDRNGNVVKRYGSTTTPRQIESDVKKLI